MTPTAPELSIIIPVLNESDELPALFHMLSRQRNVAFELVVSDGGSCDNTVSRFYKLIQKFPFPCRLIHGERSRAKQLNVGASLAEGKNLLFLHADSQFADAYALERGLLTLKKAANQKGDERVAGYFPLYFNRQDKTPSLPYTYYEWKAHLDRPECTHGDQGFLLSRCFFEEVGPFDESVAVLEDTRLAEVIRQKGNWVRLPCEIFTSARRFESEGLFERQVLNAFIMNFSAIGWESFFREMPGVYRSQDRTARLRLLPFFKKIRGFLRELPWRERVRLWYLTGGYVRSHGWQLAFFLDVRRNFWRKTPADEKSTPILDAFDRWYDLLTDHLPGRAVAGILAWLWFYGTFVHLYLREVRFSKVYFYGK